ncbi:hypothetical protein ACS0TY_029204 [Phlomoides rotata]
MAQNMCLPPLVAMPPVRRYQTQTLRYGTHRISLSACFCSLPLRTEESMAHVLGCNYSRFVWLSLESAIHQTSKSCELRLKDDLQLMKKCSRSISEYGSIFRNRVGLG